MATRFFGWENATAPITPAVDAAWSGNAAPFAWKPMHTTARFGDTALTTIASFTSSAGQNRAHRSWIGRPMAAGNAFTTSTTFKAYAQVLESLATNNAISRIGVRIVNEAGTTVQATLKAVADYSTGGEWNTALRNKAFADGDVSAVNYTTVDGDRLVVEWGHSDTAGASISTSSRWGSTDAAIANLPEDETTTTTTMRPWFETSLNITFKTPVEEIRYVLIDGVNTSGGNGTTNTNSGTNRAFVSMAGLIANAWFGTDFPTANKRPTIYFSGTVADANSTSNNSGTRITAPDCYMSMIFDSPTSLIYSASYFRGEPSVKGIRHFVNDGILYLRMVGYQFKSNPPDSGGFLAFNPSSFTTLEPYDVRVDRMCFTSLLNNTATGGPSGCNTLSVSPNGKVTITNSLGFGFKGTGSTHSAFKTQGGTVDWACENCTAYDCNRGFDSSGTTFTAKNCGAASCTDGFAGTFNAASTNNASDLASDAPGSAPRNSVTPSFIGGGDFHLTGADTAWTGQGVDLSADARLPFSTDGDGATCFAPWSIGADFALSSVPVKLPPPFIYTNQSVQRAANW